MLAILRRWTAATVPAVITAALLVVGVVDAGSAGAAPPPIGLTKAGPASVLEAEQARYTLTASNPSGGGAVPQYNASFTDVLAAGVSYVSGSTQPADLGEPTIVVDPATGRQTLIWRDLFDLQPGGTDTVSFAVSADPAVLPVGSSFADTATGYTSRLPRIVPRFTATGAPVPNPAVTASAPASATTSVTALQITKDEPSPEAKLLRGVHDHPTLYTLTVTETDVAPTTGVVVTDYLPASLEFLGCGGADNGSTGPEYPGAPPLTGTPAPPGCVLPSTVETVTDPAGYPPGVYTKVTWNLGTLARSERRVITFAAGVPLRQNTATFPGSAPSPASLGQASNLDNNTGPSTRQDGDAAAVTNRVEASGTYTGTVAPGTDPQVTASGEKTDTINDLRVVKSVEPDTFASGGLATYTLKVDSSEYVDNSTISITDTIPNGVCPLDTTRNYVTGAPADCDPGTVAPSVPYQSVTQNPDGTFTVVLDPIAVPHNGSTTITYQVRMRDTYTGGALAGAPTVAGDTFTNRASEAGTSTPVPGTGETGDNPFRDSTSATQTSPAGTLAKLIEPRANPQDCAAGTYADPRTLTAAQLGFLKGDRVCFQITVPFAAATQTRNPVLTDFLPDGTAYEAGSFVLGPANTVPNGEVRFDETGAADGNLTWTLGAPEPDGSLAVPAGSVFQARFSVLITAAAPGPAPDKTGNIAKLRTENSSGQAVSLRSEADFSIAPAPPVAVLKGVQSVDGQPVGGNPPNVDGVQVVEGDTVVFRVDVTNGGSAANANDQPVHTLRLWDVLPPGIRCAQVSAISDGGACTDPGDPGQPNFAQAATLSALMWNRPAGEAVAPGATRTFTYAMTVPAGTGVAQTLADTASVRSFDVDNNVPGVDTTYFPQDNVDTTVPTDQQDAPPASDPSNVVLPAVAVAKHVSSAIAEAGNTGLEPPPGAALTQATIGEQVTYTITADVPAHTTVYRGVLADPVPSGLQLVSATAGFSPDPATAPATSLLPDGVTFDPTAPRLTLPTSYANTTAAVQRFQVTVTAVVTQDPGNVTNVFRLNTATFTSAAPPNGVAPTPQTASSTVAIVEPSSTMAKSVTPATATGGQTVTFTLTPRNAATASVLHDGWVVDCLPAGLTFLAYGTPTQGSTAPAVPGAGAACAGGTTQLSWNVGDLAPGAAPRLTYTASVDPTAAGGQKYTNAATVSGNSLAGARSGPIDPGNPAGRSYSAPASSTVTVAGGGLTKSVTPTTATVGQSVSYTTKAQFPANVTFYSAAIIDTLPAGIDAASVRLGTVGCANADGSACALTGATALNRSGTTIGWLLGDVAPTTQVRTVTLTYTATVADVGAAKAGARLTNRARLSWNTSRTPPPTSAGASFNQSSGNGAATVTVAEPSLSIVKSVDDTTVEPVQVVTYTVRVSNAAGATVSAAYNATVTDAVPAGVVVDPGSISNGGTLSGADPTTGAGGTISWTLPGPVAPGGAVALTYRAVLAPSGQLTTAGQTNTTRVTGYQSLPSGGRAYPATPPATATITPTFPRVTAGKSTPGGTTAYVGESFPWQLTLTNTGAGTAYSVGATDVPPPNWSYDTGSARVSVNGGPAAAVEPSVSTTGGVATLTWTGLGTLPPGAGLTITYTATATPGVAGVPGVGLAVDHTNTVTPSAADATGATGNASGTYGGPSASAVAHVASADVVLSKAVARAPVAGGTGTWTITVSNGGLDPATGPFVVTDPAPAPASGVTVVGAAGDGWSCSTGATITCQRTDPANTLAAGASFPAITVTYAVAPGVPSGTTLSNTASVTARSYDPDPANNSATATATVSTSADLALTKRLSSPELIAGRQATYILGVTNLGPSQSAPPFTVQDTLPAGASFVSATGAGWSCTESGGGVTCAFADALGVGEAAPDITLTIGVPSAQTADVVNTARTTATTTPDPNPGNDTATVTTPPVLEADLAIRKVHQGEFVAGARASYAITVTNTGPSDAADATVTDTLPSNVGFVASGDADWSCSAEGQDVTCVHADPLPAGSTTTFVLNVQVSATSKLPAINSATVTSTTPDPDDSNNTDADNATIDTEADLVMSKAGPATAVAGGPDIAFTLGVRNAGPSDVPGAVTVTDPLPAGLTYVTADGDGWSCGYTAGTRLVTCTLAAGLPAGQAAASITLRASVDPDAGPSTITNTADVRSDTDDPDPSNNSAEAPVQVTVDAPITLTKTLDTASPVTAGTNATFTLTATATGPSDATEVSVTDTLPEYLTPVSASGDGWTCQTSGQDVLCTRDRLAVASPAGITLVARVSPSTPITPPDGQATLLNAAGASAGSPGEVTDPDPVPVSVEAQAHLTLTKTPSAPTASAGQTLTWTLQAANTGPSDAAAPITVTDTLPAYESLSTADAPWTCQASPAVPAPGTQQAVTCTLDAGLPVGAEAPPLQLLVQIAADAPSAVHTNTATVSSPTPGDHPSAKGSVTVGRVAALSMTKTHSGTAVIGQPLQFRLVARNSGPSAADQVVVEDNLPTGLGVLFATGDGWTCAATGATVRCTLAGLLAPNTNAAPITVTVDVEAAAYPRVVNTATVASTDPELTSTGSANDTVPVAPDARLELTKQHVGAFVVGSPGSYRLTVTNPGPTPTPGPVRITDPLAAGLDYVSAVGDEWSCAPSGRTVVCTRAGALAVGASASVVLTVTVLAAAAPAVVNTATATAPGSPPASATDTAPVTLPPLPPGGGSAGTGPGAGGPGPGGATPEGGATPGSQLSFTGSPDLDIGLVAALLIGVGLAMARIGQRRRTAK